MTLPRHKRMKPTKAWATIGDGDTYPPIPFDVYPQRKREPWMNTSGCITRRVLITELPRKRRRK